MRPKILLEKTKFDVTIKRLCHQLIEVHNDFEQTVIIGLQPRGIYLAKRIQKELQSILKRKTSVVVNWIPLFTVTISEKKN